MDTLERARITPERQRELEKLAYTYSLTLPDDMGEALIVWDEFSAIVRRWAFAVAPQETCGRAGAQVSYLRPVDG